MLTSRFVGAGFDPRFASTRGGRRAEPVEAVRSMRYSSRRMLKHALPVAATLLVLWLLASLMVTYRLTRRQQPPFAEPIPAKDWGKFEQLRLNTSDGEEIGAWLVEGP